MRYQIRVRGRLGRVRSQGEDTVLTGILADHAALYGVLARIEALGLELVEVRRESPGGVTPAHPDDRQAEPS